MSTLLCLVMLAGTATGIVLGPGWPRRPRGILLAELVMLAAMTDVCLLGGMVMSAVFWSALLVAAALALAPTVRRRDPAHAEEAAVHLVSLVLGAAMLLLADGGGHFVAGGSHHGASTPLLVPFAAAALLHAGFEARLAVRERRGRVRQWTAAARGFSAIAGTGAMIAMVAVAG
jgi:hypothetical protein